MRGDECGLLEVGVQFKLVCEWLYSGFADDGLYLRGREVGDADVADFVFGEGNERFPRLGWVS